MVAERLRARFETEAPKGREENVVEPKPVTEDWLTEAMEARAVELGGTETSKP